MSEVIRLGSSKTKKGWASITEQLQKQSKIKSTPLRLLTSPKTTAVLAGTLLTLLHPAAALAAAKSAAAKVGTVLAKHPLRYAAGGLIGTGILVESPKARKYIKETPKRLLGYGTAIGGIIEDPKKTKEKAIEKGWWPTTKEAVKKAGIYGGIAAAGLGGLALGKKYLESRKAKKEREVGLIKNDLQRAPISLKQPYVPLPSAVPYSLSPVGAPQSQISPRPIQNIIQIQVR